MKENSTGLSAATQGILYALGAYGIWGGDTAILQTFKHCFAL